MGKATKLGEMLFEAGLIDKFQLESGLSYQRNVGGRLGSALVKLGYIAEETILQFLDEQGNIQRIDLQHLQIPPDALTAIPVSKLYENMVVPIEWQTQGRSRVLVVAMTDPTNLRLIEYLQAIIGGQIQAVIAPEAEIESTLNRHYPLDWGDLEPVPPAAITISDEYSTLPGRKILKLDKNKNRLDRLVDLLVEKGVLDQGDLDQLK
jgi:type IV pilus assembly protein PilB